MSPIGLWGPEIWNFFHTMAEKIKEDDFITLGPQLFYHIKRICSHLPCPACSEHAKRFFKNAPPNAFSTKKGLKEGLFVFHNVVNRRKQKPIQSLELLDQYKTHNVVRAYERFIRVYKTRGNMKLLTDSFQRQMIITDLKRWLLKNLKSFEH